MGVALRLLALLLAILPLHHLLGAPWYRFPPPRPFRGSSWYNPYETYRGSGLRVNLHTHSRTWSGLTLGHVPASRVAQIYRDLGYDAECITNYQSITRQQHAGPIYLPAYEHALGSRHQTVLGADSVLWFDYPLPWQGAWHKQHVLDLLRGRAGVVILNHPGKNGSYDPADAEKLTAYAAVEVRSRYERHGTAFWDAALSAGRPVWGVATDDGHRQDVRDKEYAVGWVVLDVRARNAEGVIDAVRRGWFYSTWDRFKSGHNRLLSARIEGEPAALRVELAEPAERVRFVGQGGVARCEQHDTATASCPLRLEDTYLRAEAVTRGSELLLNPVFRYDGDPLASRSASIAGLPTLLARGTGILLWLAAAWFLLGLGALLPSAARREWMVGWIRS